MSLFDHLKFNDAVKKLKEPSPELQAVLSKVTPRQGRVYGADLRPTEILTLLRETDARPAGLRTRMACIKQARIRQVEGRELEVADFEFTSCTLFTK